MKLPSRSKAYIIPEYSLTGDLLSFLTCNLQYRYQNRGTLPPSKPVQRWFGEFIHGVLEEAYLQWDCDNKQFPWNWKEDIRPIEDMIDVKLQVGGLYPYDEDLFYSLLNSDLTYEELNEHDHKKLASARAEKAINIWGPHLFPLIDSTELLIKGIREMPNYEKNVSRSNYYGINGVVDVLSSIKINKNLNQTNLDNYNNRIIEFLKRDPEFRKQIQSHGEGEEYEIIIDYKGMKRPPEKSVNKFNNPWENHKQQILTYSWLRSRQEDAKPIFAGIIFYLNELVPSKEDILLIRDEIEHDLTDDAIDYGRFANDVERIMNWKEEDKAPELSEEFRIARSIRIINIDNDEIDESLEKFDSVVFNIESSLIKEIKGCKIQDAWKGESDERTCSACDFRTFCKNNSVKTKDIKIP
jgi:hypothetical protein